MTPKWKAKKSGPLFCVEEEQLDKFMVYMGRFKEGEELDLIVRKRTRSASTPQKNYYYGVICKIVGDHCGYTVPEADERLKNLFLRRKDKNGFEYTPSKNDLTTTEMSDYCETIRQWAMAYLDQYIPLPNEVVVEGDDDAEEEDDQEA